MLPVRFLVLGLLVLPSAAFSACEGADLRAALPPETMREIRARIADVPFREGIAFEAVRDEVRLTLFGTVHTSNPLVSITEEIGTRIRQADILFVEMASELEAELQRHLVANPSMMFYPEGSGLKARLTEREWEALTGALSALGVPAESADRMRPGFVSMMLEVPPCEMAALAAGGAPLDRRVEMLARAAGVAVESLDVDFEKILAFFLDGSDEAQLEMLRMSLALGDVEDALATSIGAWRDEEPLVVWELVKEWSASLAGDREMAAARYRKLEDSLLTRRNRRWLARLLDRARQVRSSVVAVGVLHLPGERGLVRLLEAEGFAIRRLAVF